MLINSKSLTHTLMSKSYLSDGGGAHPSSSIMLQVSPLSPQEAGEPQQPGCRWIRFQKLFGISWCIPAFQLGSLVYTFPVACCS